MLINCHDAWHCLNQKIQVFFTFLVRGLRNWECCPNYGHGTWKDSGNEYVDANAVFSQVILYRNVTLIAWDSFPLFFSIMRSRHFFAAGKCFYAAAAGKCALVYLSLSPACWFTPRLNTLGANGQIFTLPKTWRGKNTSLSTNIAKKYSLSNIKYHPAWCKCIHDY